MKCDSDIESDAGTNNDDQFSVMSSNEGEVDMTENTLDSRHREVLCNNSLLGKLGKTVLLTPSLDKYDVFPERIKDRSVSTPKCQGNAHLGTTIPDYLNTHLKNIELIPTPSPNP